MSLLLVDIGNSNITISIYKKNALWLPIKKISTKEIISQHISKEKLYHFFHYDKNNIETSIDSITTAIVSSVVPSINTIITMVIQKLYMCPVHFIHTNMNSPLCPPIPKELGTDLFANAVAAYTKHKQMASITVDFGTALSFTTVRSNGTIAGIAIAPGIYTSLQALVGHTELLDIVDLQYPTNTLGNTTKTALQSGIVLGNECLIKGLCSCIKKEVNEKCLLFATGGNIHLFPSLDTYFDEIDEFHTLKGLQTIVAYNTL